MEYTINAKGNSAGKPLLQTLAESAETIAEQSKEIRASVENIIKSCRKNNTVGAVHKDMLLARADNLKRLVSLYDAASAKFRDAAQKLAEGTHEDEVLSEVAAYVVFFSDQLTAQENEAGYALNILQRRHGKGFEKKTDSFFAILLL